MTSTAAWWIVGSAATLGILYWLSHSWNVTGVIEVGEPTVTYHVGNGGADAPTGSAAPVIEAPPGPHRNAVSAPISSTVAKRLLGCCASSTSRITWSRLMPCAFA
jgi:hypothetical protein